MARARNLKPGLFKNEVLGVADPLYTILFEGLWILADREGRLEDRPLRIKGEVFPYRNLEVDPMLGWLEEQGFIRRYVVAGKRYILILEFVKHQNPHKNETESVIPAPEEIGTTSEKIGRARADSLSSDSGFPLPDSPPLIPDSGSPSVAPAPPKEPEPLEQFGPPATAGKPPAKPKEPAKSAAAWQAYSAAYEARYGVGPVRNAAVNGQMAQLVGKLGAEAGPVAAFYVRSNHRWYVTTGHSVAALLKDAEKLRTEWATGRQGTAAQAALADKTQTNLNAFAPLLAEARELETCNGKH